MALALLAAGCGLASARPTVDTTTDGTGAVGGTVRLTWWGSQERNERTNAVADMFERRFPGTEVDRETTNMGNYFKRLNVQAAGRNLPCLTQLQGRQLNDYTSRDVLLPLDPMVESGAIDVGDIPGDVLDSGRGPDGKLYFIPYGAAYDALMVNTTLAEQSGAGMLASDYDWQDFASWARKAQSGLPEGTAATNLRGGQPNYFIAYIQGHGKRMFAEDGTLGFPKRLLTDYFRMWEGLRADGATTTPAAVAEEPTQPEESYIARGRVMSDSRPGNTLAAAQETLGAHAQGQDLTTLPLPSGPEGSGNVLITSGFAIPRSCGNMSTAAAFIDFWTNNPDAGRAFASDNGAVTNTELLDDQLADPDLPPKKKQELHLYQEIVRRGAPAILYPPGYQAVFEQAFIRTYQDVSFGHATPEEGADAFFTEANAALGKQPDQ
ncbi:sugar ABC transporter substrate-binding protein [Streptomonospora sediminis]